MGKKRSKKKSPDAINGSQASVSLREESTGKKQTNINAKTMLKLEHIKNLSLWASGEASIPSLSALFGRHLAAGTEALGIPPDPSLFTCQRCESVLQPGYNCTVRIEKNPSKLRRRHKKPNNTSQNNVVYSCNFCSHRNLIRGTPLGHMKAKKPQKAKPSSKSGPSIAITKTAALAIVPKADAVVPKYETTMIEDEPASAVVPKNDPLTESPATSLVGPGPTLLNGEKNEVEAEAALIAAPKSDLVVPGTPLIKPVSTLLDGKKRKRNRSSSKKGGESECGSGQVNEGKGVSTSSKRKRKSWTSLKEIAESREQGNEDKLKNLTVPFFL